MARYLLLPRSGFSPERCDAALRAYGLQRDRAQPRYWSDGATPQPSAVVYREDPTLGLRRIYTLGPRAAELRDWCAAEWPCWSAAEVLLQAVEAASPADRVATMAPLVAVLEDDAAAGPAVRAVLQTRLDDEVPAVRRAALLVLASLPEGAGAALLQALVDDPQLGPAARSQLAASATADGRGGQTAALHDPAALHERAAVALRAGELALARRLSELLLELEPLTSAAYFLRAQVSAADGRVWPALLDATLALALARREGVHLQVLQELQTRLRAQLPDAPPTAAVELQAVAQLTMLLRHGRLHEVEEIAETLLALPGRAPLWWLTVGLARWERGRPDSAAAALETALAAEPELLAARFLLGQCRLALGDDEAALSEFARLDPVAGQRAAQPSLLAAYADELLGTQAPWEAREHAFARVQFLREHGRLAEALTVMTTLLREEPDAADALVAQGILFGELGQPAAALVVLDQALAALRPAERLLADEDPLGTVQWHRAAALTALGSPQAAAAARQVARSLGVEQVAAAAPEQAPGPHGPDESVRSAAAYAELRRIAQQSLLQDDTGATPPETEASPRGPLDASVARAAQREQVAELLVAALGALDVHATADARRAIVQRAERGLNALSQLAPQLVTAPAVHELIAATARALGIVDATTQP